LGRQLNLLFQKLTGLIDSFNDKLTSYRLMLYFLLTLVGWAVAGSFFHNQVPYTWHQILISAGWLAAVCWVANKLIARFLNIPANKESDLITALILALILSPPTTVHQFALTAAAAVAAIVSKFVITVHKSHLFNPAAIGAFVSGELFHSYAAWWVGTKFMAPVVFIGGLLIMRKMKRYTLVAVFMAFYILYLIFTNNNGGNLHFLWLELVSTPVLFFAYVMLIEPQTTPSQLGKYIPYALLVGLFYSDTKLKISPEEALLIGNIFTFIFARKRRYVMKFICKRQEAAGIFSYAFAMPSGLNFKAGQYMEWTIAQNKTDSRGNRRYLTISSSPTEKGIMFSIKHPPKASAFKQKLNQLKPGDAVLASDLSGSFTLPKDTSKKVALMAGGVGITPFRSMAKYLIDAGEKRDVVLLYSASDAAEFSFQDLFKQAAGVGMRTSYVTDKVDSSRIKSIVPDFKQRTFYISGPYPYVHAMESSLLRLGVSPAGIITDYFPGYGY
jgi:glycine betaine catabolism B